MSRGGGATSLNRANHGFPFAKFSLFLAWFRLYVFRTVFRVLNGASRYRGRMRGFGFGLATPCIDRISEKD